MPDPIRASKIRSRPVDWLWEERIPRAKLTILGGKRDQGKGLFCAHLAAAISNSRFKGSSRARLRWGKVLYSAWEDDAEVMTKPRLEAAGANLENVELWRFMVPAMMEELAEHLVREQYDLVVMDPLAAHLSRGTSRHADNLREVLNPLTTLIEKTRTAVVVVDHVLKRVPPSGDPIDAIGGGSSGMVAAARMGFLFGRDPDDIDRRVLCCVKHNICEKPPEMAFEIDVRTLPKVGELPILIPDGECTFDPMRMLRVDRNGRAGRPPDKRAAAAQWLTNYLYAAGVPVRATKAMEDALQFGITSKTLRNARVDIGIVISPTGGGRNATWGLPDELKKLMDDANGIPSLEEREATLGLETPSSDAETPGDSDNTITITDADIEELLGGGSDGSI
jgi:hypothetical protein